jgi:hypothetical protein
VLRASPAGVRVLESTRISGRDAPT